MEAVNPVSAGKARGRQLTLKDGCYSDSKAGPIGDKVGFYVKSRHFLKQVLIYACLFHLNLQNSAVLLQIVLSLCFFIVRE